MRILIYTIVKNEALHLERWYNSSKDADYHVIMDTGSTDNTIAIAKELGIKYFSSVIDPWRFDVARNRLLHVAQSAYPSSDICIAMDADEVLSPGWRERLESAWKLGETNRVRYPYAWSFKDGKPDCLFQADKIHALHSHYWKTPVHECLIPVDKESFSEITGDAFIEHHPDSSKPRSSYLPLLRLACQEDLEDDRSCHYYARELFFHNQYEEAIAEFSRHLTLKSAIWQPERASSYRYMSKCYNALNDPNRALVGAIMSVSEDLCNESLMCLALQYYMQSNWANVLNICNLVLGLKSSSSYMNESYARNEGPHDLLANAYYHLGDHSNALLHAQLALSFNPTDQRLIKNLEVLNGSIN
jgi:glycosyltransferase involved in cell wall biosynthesis